MAGMGDSWGTREELLHPRGPDGKFRNKWGMAEGVVSSILNLLSKFNLSTFQSDGQASQYLHNKAKPSRFGGGQGYARLGADYHSSNDALRAGTMDTSTKKFVDMMDASSTTTTEDIVVSRRVGPEAFGLGPEGLVRVPDPEADGVMVSPIEDFTGKLVADRGYTSSNIGTPLGSAPIQISIAVPKGTKVIIPGRSANDRQVYLDRDQEIRITKVKPDGRGGYYMWAVATERTPGETPIPIGGPGQASDVAPREGEVLRGQELQAKSQKIVPDEPLQQQAPQPGDGGPSPQGPVDTGPGGPPPRNEPVVSEAIGTGGAPQATTPPVGTPEAPGGTPETPIREADFKEAAKAVPIPSAGKRRAQWNHAYLGIRSGKRDPDDILRELKKDIEVNKADLADRKSRGNTDDPQLADDIQAQEQLADLIGRHHGIDGKTSEETPVAPEPVKAVKRAAPAKLPTPTPEQERDITDLSPQEQKEYRSLRRKGQSHDDSLQGARDSVGVKEANRAAAAEKALTKKAAPAKATPAARGMTLAEAKRRTAMDAVRENPIDDPTADTTYKRITKGLEDGTMTVPQARKQALDSARYFHESATTVGRNGRTTPEKRGAAHASETAKATKYEQLADALQVSQSSLKTDKYRRAGGGAPAAPVKKAVPEAPPAKKAPAPKKSVEGAAPGTAAGKITAVRLTPGTTVLINKDSSGAWRPTPRKTGATKLKVTGNDGLAGKGGRRQISGTGPDGEEIKINAAPSQTFIVDTKGEKQSPADIAAALEKVTTRAEAEELLKGKTIAELKEIAAEAKMPMRSKNPTKAALTNDLIDITAGGRIQVKEHRDFVEGGGTPARSVRTTELSPEEKLAKQRGAPLGTVFRPEDANLTERELYEQTRARRGSPSTAASGIEDKSTRDFAERVLAGREILRVNAGQSADPDSDNPPELADTPAKKARVLRHRAETMRRMSDTRFKGTPNSETKAARKEAFKNADLLDKLADEVRKPGQQKRVSPSPDAELADIRDKLSDPNLTRQERLDIESRLARINKTQSRSKRLVTDDEILAMTVPELKQLAATEGVTDYKNLRKADLQAKIRAHREAQANRTPEDQAIIDSLGSEPTPGLVPATPTSIMERISSFDNPPTREEAHELLKPLLKRDLVAMANDLSVPGAQGKTKNQLQDEIVEATTGRRLDSIATRGFTGRRPGTQGGVDIPEDEQNVLRALRRVEADRGREPGRDWVGMADLREAMDADGISREDQDTVLRKMAQGDHPGAASQEIRLIPVANRKALSDRDRKAALVTGEDQIDMIKVNPSYDNPTPVDRTPVVANPVAQKPIQAPDRAADFRLAWTQGGDGFKATGSAGRQLDEIRDDIGTGKITPDEGIRRLETEIGFNKDELAEMDADLRGDMGEEQRHLLKQKRDALAKGIATQEKASSFLRTHFKKEPLATPDEVSVELNDDAKQALDAATPDGLRKAARAQGITVKGETKEEILKDLVRQMAGKELERRERQKSIEFQDRVAAPPKAPDKPKPNLDESPYQRIDSRALAEGLDLRTAWDQKMLDGIQAQLDGKDHSLGKNPTPAQIGRALETWANGPAGPFYRAATMKTTPPPGRDAEWHSLTESFRAQGAEWLKLADRLKNTRRRKKEEDRAPDVTPKVTKDEKKEIASVAEVTGIPAEQLEAKALAKKRAEAPPKQSAVQVADTLKTVGSREEAKTLLQGRTKAELVEIAKASDTTVSSSLTKPKMIDAITEQTVGGRLQFEVLTRGGMRNQPSTRSRADLEDMSLADLVAIEEELGIQRASLNRGDRIQAILDKQGEAQAAPTEAPPVSAPDTPVKQGAAQIAEQINAMKNSDEARDLLKGRTKKELVEILKALGSDPREGSKATRDDLVADITGTVSIRSALRGDVFREGATELRTALPTPKPAVKPAGPPLRSASSLTDLEDSRGVIKPRERPGNDEPIHFPNGGRDQGNMHLDSAMGQLWQELYADDREPNSFVNEIGRMGDRMGVHGDADLENDVIPMLERLRDQASDSVVEARIQQTIDSLSAPPAPPLDLPEGTPAPLRAAMEQLARIPTARKTGRLGAAFVRESVLDKKSKLIRDFVAGEVGFRDFENRLEDRDLHESADGAFRMWSIFERLFNREPIVGYREGAGGKMEPITEKNPDADVVRDWIRATRRK